MRNRPIYPFLAFAACGSTKSELVFDLNHSATHCVLKKDTFSANGILVHIHVNPTVYSHNNDPLHTYIF
ncbi:hypothetical protein N9772_06535 [Bacteroidia bacterium]|nr:hypothetical protein [Bacteroidia bacterium]